MKTVGLGRRAGVRGALREGSERGRNRSGCLPDTDRTVGANQRTGRRSTPQSSTEPGIGAKAFPPRRSAEQ